MTDNDSAVTRSDGGDVTLEDQDIAFIKKHAEAYANDGPEFAVEAIRFKRILASLREFKRIRKAETDVNRASNPDLVICPNCVHEFRAVPENLQHFFRELGDKVPCATGGTFRGDPLDAIICAAITHIDALTAYADRMAAERDALGVKAAENFSAAVDALERAESAEAKLAAVEKGLREPSEGILNAGLVAAGLWMEPFSPATECGVPIECGLTQAEADEINAACREDMLQVFQAMSAELLRQAAERHVRLQGKIGCDKGIADALRKLDGQKEAG